MNTYAAILDVEPANQADNMIHMRSSGDWRTRSLHHMSKKMDAFCAMQRKQAIAWDLSGLTHIDSAGMVLIIHYYDMLIAQQCQVQLCGLKPEHENIYQLMRKYGDNVYEQDEVHTNALESLHDLGRKTVGQIQHILAFLAFIGEHTFSLLYTIRHPFSLRVRAVFKNIEEAGVRSLPIIALTSFLIGIVIAYQGAVQLEKFGANIFIVDMISVSVTRELAPLITAIVIAGRTGSSYTAQLGAMRITEEIDAMRTMGFDPHRFLVLPRIIALMVAMPLLIFFADMISIGAGMFISNIHLNLSYTEFIHRLQVALDLKHVWIGLLKGPFFAWLIAVAGCYHGFQVSKNTESIGRFTTISVVHAIFLVIACDALFSVILTELGL